MIQNVQLNDIKPETQNLKFLAVRENFQDMTLNLKWSMKLPREKNSTSDEDIIKKPGIKLPKGENSVN